MQIAYLVIAFFSFGLALFQYICNNCPIGIEDENGDLIGFEDDSNDHDSNHGHFVGRYTDVR